MRLLTKEIITKEECLSYTDMQNYLKGNSLYYVYFLVDPFNYQVKYVGKGVRDRLFHHIYNRDYVNNRKFSWLDKLYKRNKEPLYVIWEFYADESRAYEQENNFIAMFGRKGIDNKGTLLNLSISMRGYKFHCRKLIKDQSVFIEEANLKHNHRYDYSLVKYKNNYTKVDIICKEHGLFSQSPANHLTTNGCSMCRTSSYDFPKYAKQVWGDFYDYSQSVYVKNDSKLKIKCKCDTVFEQTPFQHLHKKDGCPNKCHSNNQKTGKFIEEMKNKYGDLYSYDKVEYKGSLEKVQIFCLNCKEYFYKTPNKHKSGQGCPRCKQSQ